MSIPARIGDACRRREAGAFGTVPVIVGLIAPVMLIAAALLATDAAHASSTARRYDRVEANALSGRQPGVPGRFSPATDGPTERADRADQGGAASSTLGRLRAAGWVCPELLGSGLRLQVVRYLPREAAIQLTYSDGVAEASVFEQRGRLDVAALAGYEVEMINGGRLYRRTGPPTLLVWQTGDRVFTVVADAPGHVVSEALRVLPPPENLPSDNPRRQTFFDRLLRGLSRVASWFNPFA